MASLMVIATCVIAGFTVALFFLQKRQHEHDRKVANANYMFTLFDKRMHMYSRIEYLMNAFLAGGEPDFDAAVKLHQEAKSAQFLLPEGPQEFIDELVNKSLDHQRAGRRFELLSSRRRNGVQLSDEQEEEFNNWLDRMHEIEDWFHTQIEDGRLAREFEPHLMLPVSL